MIIALLRDTACRHFFTMMAILMLFICHYDYFISMTLISFDFRQIIAAVVFSAWFHSFWYFIFDAYYFSLILRLRYFHPPLLLIWYALMLTDIIFADIDMLLLLMIFARHCCLMPLFSDVDARAVRSARCASCHYLRLIFSLDYMISFSYAAWFRRYFRWHYLLFSFRHFRRAFIISPFSLILISPSPFRWYFIFAFSHIMLTPILFHYWRLMPLFHFIWLLRCWCFHYYFDFDMIITGLREMSLFFVILSSSFSYWAAFFFFMPIIELSFITFFITIITFFHYHFHTFLSFRFLYAIIFIFSLPLLFHYFIFFNIYISHYASFISLFHIAYWISRLSNITAYFHHFRLSLIHTSSILNHQYHQVTLY